ncbi:hypothetical protein BJX76DRAFT_94278 [Aspergillus varians]
MRDYADDYVSLSQFDSSGSVRSSVHALLLSLCCRFALTLQVLFHFHFPREAISIQVSSALYFPAMHIFSSLIFSLLFPYTNIDHVTLPLPPVPTHPLHSELQPQRNTMAKPCIPRPQPPWMNIFHHRRPDKLIC